LKYIVYGDFWKVYLYIGTKAQRLYSADQSLNAD